MKHSVMPLNYIATDKFAVIRPIITLSLLQHKFEAIKSPVSVLSMLQANNHENFFKGLKHAKPTPAPHVFSHPM
jgi:hypothetical protein